MGVERELVLPEFQNRKAVQATRLVQYVKAQIAIFLAASITVALKQWNSGGERVRLDLHIGDKINRAVLRVGRRHRSCRQNEHCEDKLNIQARACQLSNLQPVLCFDMGSACRITM